MSVNIMYLDSDNTIRAIGLKKNDGSYINNATCECIAILDQAGNVMNSITYPIPMPYESGSDGNYTGTAFISSVDFVDGGKYTAKIQADGGPGMKRAWEVFFGVVMGNL